MTSLHIMPQSSLVPRPHLHGSGDETTFYAAAECVLLFLVLVENSALFQFLRSYTLLL